MTLLLKFYGVVAFVRTDIPTRRRNDLEMQQTESIVYEVTINESKWAFMCIYRPPSQSNETFSQELFKCLDKCSTIYDNHIILGDLNYDLLSEIKSKPLVEIMELFDLKNIITDATYFKKGCTPTLNDVILKNVSKRCMKCLNFPTGISDCQNFISTVINSNVAKDEMSIFEYRSFTALFIALTINNMITTKRKTIISPRRVQSASSVRIPQNIGRSLLPTINITPSKLSSVSSIRLNGASNCNIFRNSLRIRLSPVKSPIIRKYKNLDKRRSLYPLISTCNVKSCICCSHLNC